MVNSFALTNSRTVGYSSIATIGLRHPPDDVRRQKGCKVRIARYPLTNAADRSTWMGFRNSMNQIGLGVSRSHLYDEPGEFRVNALEFSPEANDRDASLCGIHLARSFPFSRTQARYYSIVMPSKAAIGVSSSELSAERTPDVCDCDRHIASRVIRAFSVLL